jgi:hypothetical protein
MRRLAAGAVADRWPRFVPAQQILIVALLVTAAPAAAQEPAPAAPAPATTPAGRPIRLGEALDVLVRQSGALARAEVDVAIADAARSEASGLDDWRLSATGAWVSNRRGFIAGQPFQAIADDASRSTPA